MHICFISHNYPSRNINNFFFVKQLVDAMADLPGVKCSVVSPYSITRHKNLYPFKSQYMTPKGNPIKLYRPNYVSTSNLKIGGVNISYYLAGKAINWALNKVEDPIDVIYGHFWRLGNNGYQYAKKHNIPLFVASGESIIPNTYSTLKYKDFVNYVKGVICVSSKNKEESIRLGLTYPDKCIVVPNAIDNTLFRKLNKVECRKKLGLPQKKFIVAFVGWFINRKGPDRVAKAINQTKQEDIYSIFIGEGDFEPQCDNILLKSTVPHHLIPEYLNASDVFVLPTLNEGCCNAIIEAMACGLPIISSDRMFNYDVLNEKNSLMIEPTDVNQLSEAILNLKNNPNLRAKLSEGSLAMAESLKIEDRAKRIKAFIEHKIL